jgi:hypothetical protein
MVSVRLKAFRTHVLPRQTKKVHNTPLLPHVCTFLEPSVLSLYNVDSCVILLDVWQCSVDWKQGQSKSFIYSTNIHGGCGIRRRYSELSKVNSIITKITNPYVGVVTIYTTKNFRPQICILPTHIICAFYVIITLNRKDYMTRLSNGNKLGSL